MKFLKFTILAITLYLSTAASGATASVLNHQDQKTYKKIFALQQDGKWKKADVLIKKIDNKILMGQVLFQRYMHPTKYRAKYKELHHWLKSYNDHPGSKQLHKLAERRRPGGWKKPNAPVGLLVPNDLYQADKIKPAKKKYRYKGNTYSILKKISRSVQKGNVTNAKNYLEKNRKYLSRPAHAEAFGHISRGYYRYHKSDMTLIIADLGYKMDTDSSWEANWWAGLSAYRDGNYKIAEKHFKRTGESNKIDDWLYSASWYWAGRSASKAGNTSSYNHWSKAQSKIRTFYGLVAMRSMGSSPALNFSVSSINATDLSDLMRIKGFKRAVALAEVGLLHRSDRELKYIQPQVKYDLQYGLMQSGVTYNIPHIQFKAGYYLENKFNKSISEGYLYPTVPYKPYNGWVIDKALISAFIRQESQFRTYAKSSAGARGLMQLMPYTARFVARKTRVKPNSFHGTRRNFLYRPELSMTLGQSYLDILLNQQGYKNNLFYAVSAYNAGPGNLKKWRKKVNYNDDPLLFIESLPSRETRIFMERILSNFWIYRFKKNGKAPSLDAVANGDWTNIRKVRLMTIDTNINFKAISIAVITISDTREEHNDTSGDKIVEFVNDMGHTMVEKNIVKDDIKSIQNAIKAHTTSGKVQAVITTGGTGLTGRDVTPEALDGIADKTISGFGELFRMLSYDKIGTSTLQSRACAGVVDNVYVFCLPGSPGAIKDAFNLILKDQLDIRHKPCNFVQIMPRLEER